MSLSTLFMDADQREAHYQARLFFGVLAALVISSWMSWVELRYAVFSRAAEGTILQAEPHQVRSRRSTHTVLRVEYEYPDETGQRARGQQDLSISSAWKAGDPATVYYFRGNSPQPRLKGTGQVWPVLVLAGAVIFAAFSIWQMAKEASQPFSTKRTARRQRATAR